MDEQVIIGPRALPPSDPFALYPGFDIQAVADIAKALPAHSWKWGTAAEALLELYNPAIHPFPAPFLIPSTIPALAYAQEKIMLNAPGAENGLSDGDGAVGV
ncbi:hypothetical protein CPB85DRAFT_1440233 [Mucidula mucida]|nr:hypothetical protein CPB85DRAFT_1440233 [Mucidula mucida]